MLLRSLLSLTSPSGPRARLQVLILHRVLPRADPLFPDETTAVRFDAVCGWLRRWFRVMPLDTAVLRLAEGSLPARALAITFDDGYADNQAIALPILRRHGLTAAFFIASGHLDGGRMWNDTLIEAVRGARGDVLDLDALAQGDFGRHALTTVAERRAAINALLPRLKYLAPAAREAAVGAIAQRAGAQLPGDLMMSGEQVRALHQAGMVIGAHTVTHPILARLPDAEARHEITAGKSALETLIDARVGLFAYPNGKPGEDYSPRSVTLVREAGFDAAFTTARGAATAVDDRFQLPRFTPWDATRLRFGVRLLLNAAVPQPRGAAAPLHPA